MPHNSYTLLDVLTIHSRHIISGQYGVLYAVIVPVLCYMFLIYENIRVHPTSDIIILNNVKASERECN